MITRQLSTKHRGNRSCASKGRNTVIPTNRRTKGSRSTIHPPDISPIFPYRGNPSARRETNCAPPFLLPPLLHGFLTARMNRYLAAKNRGERNREKVVGRSELIHYP